MKTIEHYKLMVGLLEKHIAAKRYITAVFMMVTIILTVVLIIMAEVCLTIGAGVIWLSDLLHRVEISLDEDSELNDM